MPRPAKRQPAPNAKLRSELKRLRARLAAAEEDARRCAQEAQRWRYQLDVYQEEAAQQNEQLVEAGEAMEASHERYVSLYDYAPVAFVSLDYNGVIDDLNLAAADLLGSERERLTKLPLLSFVAPESRRAFLDHMVRCRRADVPAKTELTLRPRKGPPVPIQLSTWFGVRREGPAWEFRSALIDQSDRKAAEAQELAYQKRLRSLASELSLAEERERRRVAVEIHDNLSQNLALIKMKLGMIRHKAQAADVKAGLEEIAGLLDPVLERTRSLTFELSPPVLYELGLEQALEWLAERMSKLHNLPVRFSGSKHAGGQGGREAESREPVPHEVAVLVFQAVRELLINVVKHAAARSVSVRVYRPAGAVSVTVSDNGRGFDVAKATASRPARGGNTRGQGGFGLFSVRTRLEHMGGKMEVRSALEAGTDVTLTVPLHSGGAMGDDPDSLSGGEKPDRMRPASVGRAMGHTSDKAERPTRISTASPDGSHSSASNERSTS